MVKLWDAPGNYPFVTDLAETYASTPAVILVVDATRYETLTSAMQRVRELNNDAYNASPPLTVVSLLRILII